MQRLAGRLRVHGDECLVDEFGRHAAAHGAEVEDLRGVGVQHRPHSLANKVRPAHHDGQCAVGGAFGTPRHGGVDVHDAVSLGLL